MCPSRRCVRLAVPVALIAMLVAVVRSRRGVEVWHVAAVHTPGYDEGP
jgi:hypothetical protein